jgi:hypothetical protein
VKTEGGQYTGAIGPRTIKGTATSSKCFLCVIVPTLQRSRQAIAQTIQIDSTMLVESSTKNAIISAGFQSAEVVTLQARHTRDSATKVSDHICEL